MEIVPLPDSAAIGSLGADAVEALVRRRPDAVLGVATGSSPLPVYTELVRRHVAGTGPSYQQLRVVLLDEYVGLPEGHPESYRATIRRVLTDPLAIGTDRLIGPDPDVERLADAGERYEARLRELGGVDLQLLGIGTDAHLAFNEPGSSLGSTTRIKTLTAQTRRDNARFFASPEDVPRHVLTQGLGTILRAGHLVLVAVGTAKAPAVAAAAEGPVAAHCPASVLQLHPHVTLLVDEEAGSQLVDIEHYREVYSGKPAWQGI